MQTELDGIAARIGTQMQTAEGRKVLLAGCWKLLRKVNLGCFVFYAITLILAFVGMRYLGEQNMFFAFCIFWPPLVWFLPAIALAFTSICLLDWRTLVGLVLVSAALIVIPLGGRLPRNLDVAAPAPAGEVALTVLTNNRGQDKGGKGESLKPFMDAMRPDIMAFQESPGMANRYKFDPGYSAFPHAADVGEFVLLSKYPILSAELVSLRPSDATAGDYWPTIAARFQVQVGTRQIVVYNVHAPTPRDTLRYYMRGAALYGLLGLPGTPWAEKKKEGEKGWLRRIELVKALLERAKREKEATLLVGDFNMPQCGYLHAVVGEMFTDSHTAAGIGFGFSFPGTTRNPLSLGGVWMRIDYIFSTPGKWRCLWSQAEPSRKSQHRSVVARFALE